MNNKLKKILVYSMILSILSMVGVIPPIPTAHAVSSLTAAKDLISDSDISNASSTHIFTFTTGSTTPATGYIDVLFPAAFGDLAAANIQCPANYTGSRPNTETARCTANSDRAPGAVSITVSSVSNPIAAGPQTINITNYGAAGVPMLERAQVLVYIIDDVLMTANVSATLTFTINGVTAAQVVNGITCGRTTTATTTDFGTLSTTGSTTVCQELTVATNAKLGYTVTVFEDQELTSAGSDNINSFNNSPTGTGSTTAGLWAAPLNTLDAKHTYGHMGLTSNDQDLNTAYVNQDFYNGGGQAKYSGLNAADSLPVMHHNGPSDGLTQNKGLARVAYTAEIKSLQEAGDYQNTLTYIATPTY